jgi:hypothetical protein
MMLGIKSAIFRGSSVIKVVLYGLDYKGSIHSTGRILFFLRHHTQIDFEFRSAFYAVETGVGA